MIENVLLAQELVAGYSRKNMSPRCAIKIDLRKAFDSISWPFLINLLKAVNFPAQFVRWVEACVTSPMFSVALNGSLVGYFSGAKGVRQRDPMSLYLFVLAIEVLTRLLDRAAINGVLKFHPKCHKVKLTHLTFADDLLIFCHGSKSSIRTVMSILQDFSLLSGLQVNNSKCELYSPGIPPHELQEIHQITGFKLGELPVRYLGIPLTTRKPSLKDFQPLLDKITTRINSWTAKHLSYAGRLQLIQSVLTSIYSFWSQHFLLPMKVMKKINQLCSAFFWHGNSDHAKGARVKWDTICQPKAEGGLGLKQVKEWNVAILLKNIWIILTKAGSLWVAWLKQYILKNDNYWDYQATQTTHWGLRKLLKLKDKARKVFGELKGDFKVNTVWQALRDKHPKVFWHRFVWYTKHIPKHTLIAWMTILNKLPTKDRLSKWGIPLVSEQCLLCHSSSESRDHLFFRCPFSREVWCCVLNLCGINRVPQLWEAKLEWCVK